MILKLGIREYALETILLDAFHCFLVVFPYSHRFSRTICCKSFLRHSLGGGIAKLVALQLPVQSRPMTIAFAAPGVQYSARVLLSHMSLADIELRRRRWGRKNSRFSFSWECKKFAPPCLRRRENMPLEQLDFLWCLCWVGWTWRMNSLWTWFHGMIWFPKWTGTPAVL